MNYYKVQCLDVKFDEDEKILVIYGLFISLGEPRFIIIPKSDFHFKGNYDFPDEEMHKTARLLKGKTVNFGIDDDPSRVRLTQDNYEKFVKSFNKEIDKTLTAAVKGLEDESLQVGRKLGKLMDQGKLDVRKLMESELAVRAKL